MGSHGMLDGCGFPIGIVRSKSIFRCGIDNGALLARKPLYWHFGKPWKQFSP